MSKEFFGNKICTEHIPKLAYKYQNHVKLFGRSKYTLYIFCMDGTVAPRFVNPNLTWSYSSAAQSIHACTFQ